MESYKYKHSIQWVKNGQVTEIPSSQIFEVRIDKGYCTKVCMPKVFIFLSVDRNLLDQLILNVNSSTMVLTTHKYNDNKDYSFDQVEIKEEFRYYILKNLNPNKEIDYQDDPSEDKRNDIMSEVVTIALMKIQNINNNKRYINAIYQNNTKSDIIRLNTNHMPLVFENLDNDVVIPQIIIPPMDSINKLLSYLNNYNHLYKTPYLYFNDFKVTYIMSTSGKGVEVSDELFNNVIINIARTSSPEAKIEGFYLDEKSKSYIINVDTNEYRINKNDGIQDKYNKILGISPTGQIKESTINITEDKAITSDRYKIVYLDNENLDKVDDIKVETDRTALSVVIMKANLDSSVFTPNKKYSIKHIEENKMYNGEYILYSKAEIYVKDGENFACVLELVFKKI